METYNIHEAKTNLSKILANLAETGEVIIGKAGKPIAKLIPYEDNKKPRKLGGDWEGKVWMSDDFSDECDEINEMFYGSKIFPDGENK